MLILVQKVEQKAFQKDLFGGRSFMDCFEFFSEDGLNLGSMRIRHGRLRPGIWSCGAKFTIGSQASSLEVERLA